MAFSNQPLVDRRLDLLVAEAREEIADLEARAKAAREELKRIAARAEDLAMQIHALVTAPAPLDGDQQTARAVCLQLGYDWKSLTRKCRAKHLVLKRAAVWSVLRESQNWTLERIGAAFGFDHGTVLHSLNKFHPSKQ